MTQKQGIVSILGSDNHEKPTKAASLKRTLSADMSSKRWMAQNGFSYAPTMKKIASSEQIARSAHNSSSSEEDEEECDLNTKGVEHPRQLDIWTAILSQKAQDDSSKLPPPYVHPLVKKSASSLSEKSLKVCTESLGSETGSDVFSSYPSSETTNDEKQEHEQKQEEKEKEEEEEIKESDHEEECFSKVVKNTHSITKKTQQARSFPPPLPSLAAAHTDGPSLHMHSRRVEGRLVLEAVSVPSQNYFETQRQDGRFLLTLINNPKEEETPENNPHVEFEDIFDTSDEENSKEDDEEEEENTDEIISMGILKVQAPNLTDWVMNMHRSTVIVKRITERDNVNPLRSQKLNYNKAVKLEVVKEDDAAAPPPPPLSPVTQSLPATTRENGLPPLPPPPAATSFNSYQYFWRAKPTVASVIDPLITQHLPPTKNKAYENKDLVLLRGNKADCLLPSLKGCKEPRRSLLMWEPFCIATS